MPNDRSQSYYQGFLVPDSAFLASNLASDSSYTCPDPIPGQPVPSGTYDLALSSAGTQTSGTVTVQTQQGGNIGRSGATFIFNPGDTLVDPFLGWDAPTIITGWEPLVWGTTPALAQPFLLPLANGDLLAFYAYGTGSNNVYSARRTTGTWTTPAAIDLGATGTALVSPCAVQLTSGRILLYAIIEDGATDTATVRMLYSDDNGDTWVVGASGVLPAAFDVSSGSTGFLPNRMRVAAANGQVLLILALRSRDTTPAYASEIRQYASSDAGHTFSLVWTSDRTVSVASQQGGAYPEISVVDGTFVVGWLDLVVIKPKIRTIVSAYQSLGDATDYDPVDAEVWGTLDGGGKYFPDGDLAMVSDETGAIYLTGRQTTVSGRPWLIQRSDDLGQSWVAMARSSAMSGGGKWWGNGSTNTTYPKDAHGCWYRGQFVLLHGFAAGTSTYAGASLALSALGGYSSATMPGYDAWRIDTRQVTWGRTWNPYDKPGDMGWTRTPSGSPTESLANGYLTVTAALGSTLLYSLVPSGTVAGGIIMRAQVKCTTSSGGIRLQVADATEGYQLNISLQSSQVSVTDGITSTTLATQATTGWVDILAAIGAGGVCSVWIRSDVSDPLSPTRIWTQIVSAVSLTDDAGATITANLIGWGHVFAGATQWRFLGYITDESASYTGTGLGDASFPDDLLGRRYATTPVELSDQTAISASGGATWTGDTWTITTDYERGPARLHPEVSPSQREGARFDQTDQQDLIWDLHTGSANTGLLGYPLAVALLDTNIPAATLYGWNGAAWVSLVALSTTLTTGASYTRTGRMVRVTSGGTLSYAARNDLAGAWVSLGSSKYRRIRANTEGQIGGTTSVTAILELESVDETEPTSGTLTLYAAQVVAFVPEPSAYQRFKLTIPAFTAPEGYMRLGKVLLGSLVLLARNAENGRTVNYDPQQLTDRPTGGARTVRRLGPPIRRLALPYTNLLPTSQIYASSPAPDYVKLYSSGEEVAAAHATGPSLVGLVNELQGAPVVYLGKIPKVSATTVTNITHPQQILYGRIYDAWAYTAERGFELRTESWTLDGIVIEEEP